MSGSTLIPQELLDAADAITELSEASVTARETADDGLDRGTNPMHEPFKALLIATIVNRSRRPAPFEDGEANSSYAHLAELLAGYGIDLHVAHYANLVSGQRVLAWNRRASSWQALTCPLKDLSLCYADLPMNFPEATELRQALGGHPITIVNDLRLSDLFTDKLATWEFFPTLVPTTWNAGEPGVAARLRGDVLHPDLSVRKLFLKPRYGERGRGIRVTEPDRLTDHPESGRPDYVIQPFLETCAGIPELGVDGRHDLRLIVCDGDVVLAFVRVAAEGSYLCSFQQGGREIRVDVDRLPVRLLELVAMVDARLLPYGPRLYSLDVGFGRSGKIWIYELNTMPGVVWDRRSAQSRALHGRMHRIVARWLHGSPDRGADRNAPVKAAGRSRAPMRPVSGRRSLVQRGPALAQGVARELDPIPEVELAENAPVVGAHRHLGDAQALGDFGVLQALGHQTRDLGLPPGEVRGRIRGLGGEERAHHPAGEVGGHVAAPGEHPVDRREELLRRRALHQVADGARLEGRPHVAGVVVHGQHDHRRLGEAPAEPAGRLEAVEPGHRDIGHDDVRPLSHRRLEGRSAVADDGDHLAARLEELADARGDQPVVVGQQHARSL